MDHRLVTAQHIDDWFVENLCIRTELGTIEPFRMKPIQRVLIDYVADCFQKDVPAYLIILKARQEGISTLAEALLFFIVMNFANSRCLVTAHDDESTENVFDMANRYYDNLPGDPPETEKSSARALKFKDNNSEFVIKTAGAKGRVGRSHTLTAFHASELDFFSAALKTLQALMQSVPRVGGTVRLIESTADGPMGPMQMVWDRAVEGRNEWRPFFFAWHADAKYTRPLSWDDLEKYAEKGWVGRHKAWIEKGRRDGLGTSSARRGSAGIIGKLVGSGDATVDGGGTGEQGPGSGGESGGSGTPQLGQDEGSATPAADRGGHHLLPGSPGEPDAGDRTDEPDGSAVAPEASGSGGVNGRLSGGSAWGARRKGDPTVGDITAKTSFGLNSAMESSLTEYEEALMIEFSDI